MAAKPRTGTSVQEAIRLFRKKDFRGAAAKLRAARATVRLGPKDRAELEKLGRSVRRMLGRDDATLDRRSLLALDRVLRDLGVLGPLQRGVGPTPRSRAGRPTGRKAKAKVGAKRPAKKAAKRKKLLKKGGGAGAGRAMKAPRAPKPPAGSEPAVRPDVRPAVRPEVRPEILPEVRPEVRPAILVEVAPEMLPEVRPEIGPGEPSAPSGRRRAGGCACAGCVIADGGAGTRRRAYRSPPAPTRRTAQADRIRRTPHMDIAPEALRPGTTFEVSIYVDQKAARAGEQTVDVVVEAGAEVEIQLIASAHFAINGSPLTELRRFEG
jgi:hypothetical protein